MSRPRSFHPDSVLEKALLLFWRQGYENASVRDIVAATGVNRFSLYTVYRDKRGLLLAVLDHYCATRLEKDLAPLESAPDGAAAIRDYFDRQLAALSRKGPIRGCFLIKCAVELGQTDPEIAARIRRLVRRMEEGFFRALCRAAPGAKPNRYRRLARALAVGALGLNAAAFGGVGRKTLAAAVKTYLRLLP